VLTPLECLKILQRAFEKAKYSGLHDNIHPLPINLASELVGLITRKDIATSKHTSQKIKKSFSRMLPPHIITALHKW
jgi:CBS domain-containing protein